MTKASLNISGLRAALGRVRHLKRGTEYEVLGEAEAQVSEGMQRYLSEGAARIIHDGHLLTVYRDPKSGKLWCRFTDEFRDGRFETLPSAPDPDKAGDREGVDLDYLKNPPLGGNRHYGSDYGLRQMIAAGHEIERLRAALSTGNEEPGREGAIPERVSLADCPIGLFLTDSSTLCLKTEYGNNEGRIDAYIVESGETFWGDPPQTIASQRGQLVRPVPLERVAEAITLPFRAAPTPPVSPEPDSRAGVRREALAEHLAQEHVANTDAEDGYSWEGTDDVWKRSFRAKADRALAALQSAPTASAAAGPVGTREPLIHIDPQSRAGKEPCGECHLPVGETCDICGARHPTPTPDPHPVPALEGR